MDNLDEFEFEVLERRRFFNTFYPQTGIIDLLVNMSENEFPDVRVSTLQGLEQGVRRYKRQHAPDAQTIYDVDLADFAYDTSTQEAVQRHLQSTHPHLEDIPAYARDLRENYQFYIINHSKDAFDKRFRQGSGVGQ